MNPVFPQSSRFVKHSFAQISLLVFCLLTVVGLSAQTQLFSTPGTTSFTVPAGVTCIQVEAWGAGGGGSSISNGSTLRGGGGGGGAYVRSTVSVVALSSYNVVVGAGGAGGLAGGNSSFNGTAVIAAGGGAATSNSATAGVGGAIANSTGDLKNFGGNGANGGSTFSGGGGGSAGSITVGGNASLAVGGLGAAENGGNGAAGVSGSLIGIDGLVYGGGGSGAVTNSATSRAGGSGAGGYVRITWSTTAPTATNTGPYCVGNTIQLTGGGNGYAGYQWTGPNSYLTALPQGYFQDLNTLPSGSNTTWTDNSTIANWYSNYNGLTLIQGNGSGTTGGFYNFGNTGTTERALGSLGSSTSPANLIRYGTKLTNSTGLPINQVFINYTGEKWRGGTTTLDSLSFSYSVDPAASITTGTYINYGALSFISPNSTAGTLDGNLAANRTAKSGTIVLASPLAAGATIWLRWSDIDNTASDDGLAVDDLQVYLSGAQSPSITSATVAMAGVYTLTVTGTTGCTSTATTSVVVGVTAGTTVTENSGTANDGIVCTGSSVTLNGTGGTSYIWSDGISNGAPFTPTMTTTYTVTVTNGIGCTATATRVITVNGLPTAGSTVTENSGTANDGIVCAGTSVTLNGTGGTSYAWSDGITEGAPFTVISTTTYFVTVTNSNGCTATASRVITVNGLPSAGSSVTENSGTANDGTVCNGTIVTLNGTGGISYAWSDGITDGTPFTPTMTTTYIVTVTNSTGCTATSSRTITVNDLPICSISGPDGPLCPASPDLTYTAPMGLAAYAWSISGNGSIIGSTTSQEVSVTAGLTCGGGFILTLITTDNGCSSTCTKTVNTVDNVAPAITGTISETTIEGCTAADATAAVTTVAELELLGLTVTDACTSDASLVVTSTQTETGTCPVIVTRTYVVTDACSNSATATQVINVDDTTIPIITASGTTLVLGCNPLAAAIEDALGTATASDNCGLVTPTFVDGAVMTSGCSNSQTRTWNVTDACGNSALAVSRTVSWTVDTEAPVIVLGTAGPLPCNPSQAQVLAAFGSATVTDNCDNNLVASFSIGTENSLGNCMFSITMSWNTADHCGNPGYNAQTLTFTRNSIPPTISLPIPGMLGCNPTEAQIISAFGTATATDYCSGSTYTVAGVLGSEAQSGCDRQITMTWTAIDACGNIGSGSRTINYTRDLIAPDIFVSGSLPVPCNPSPFQIEIAFGNASVNDNCSTGLIANEQIEPEQGSGCNFSTTKTWTVTDNCNNTGTTSQTVYYTRDNEVPMIAIGIQGTPSCNPSPAQIAAAFGSATITDNCATGLVAIETIDAETGSGCDYSTTKTWTVTDNCGNTSTTSQTVMYTRDLQGPTLTGVDDVTIGCNPSNAQISSAFGFPSASDNCGIAQIIANQVQPEQHLGGCNYSTTKYWGFRDQCANESYIDQVVFYTRDLIDPVISVLPAEIVGCNPDISAIAAAYGSATVTDNCSTNLVAVGILESETGSECDFSTTKTWTVTDDCGNEATTSQTVYYTRDLIAPQISMLPALPVPCNPTNLEIISAFGKSNVTDNCSEGLLASGSYLAETGSGCNYSTTKVLTVTDDCGNIGTTSQTVTYIRNTSVPVITVTDASTPICNPTPAEIDAAFGTASAVADCGGTPTITSQILAETGSGCIYSTTKVWTATDDCGNISTTSQTVTYTRDLTAPELSGATSIGIQCNPDASTVNNAFVEPTMTDNCSTPFIQSAVTSAETNVGCQYSTARTWIVSDDCGNKASFTQAVTYTRNFVPPTIVVTQGPVTCNMSPEQIDAALGIATATSVCGGTVSISSPPNNVNNFGCIIVITKVWIAIDDCGNVGSVSRTIAYANDLQAPEITLSPNTLAVTCNPTSVEIDTAFGEPSVIDYCTGASISSSDQTANIGCTYTSTRTWIATDGCGNSSSASKSLVYTIDLEAPVISISAAVTLTCSPSIFEIEAAFGAATVSDNCSTGLTATGTVEAESGSGCFYSTTKTWTVTDACGNVGTNSQTVTYSRDTESPTLQTAEGFDLTLGCNPTPQMIEAAFMAPVFSDNCGFTVSTSTNVTSSSSCISMSTRTWTATDACGNSLSASQTLTYNVNSTPPSIEFTTVGACYTSVALAEAAAIAATTASSVCGGPVVITVVVSGTCNASITVTATDACGLTSTGLYSTRIDNTNPTTTAGSIATCYPSVDAAEAAAITATMRSDNCTGGLIKTATTVGTCPALITVTATDACGNTSSVSYNTRIDNTPPVVNCGSAPPIALDANCQATVPDYSGLVSITDNCGIASVVQVPAIGTPISGVGTVNISLTATDMCGNSSNCIFTAQKVDLIAPIISPMPSNLTVACSSTSNATITTWLNNRGGASATNNCSSTTIWTNNYGGAAACNPGGTVVTFTATDQYGNSSTATATVMIIDNTPPTITKAATSATAYCTATSQITLDNFLRTRAGAKATDVCSGSAVAWTHNYVENISDACGNTGSVLVTFTATDNCGNIATTTATFTINDVAAPVLTIPANITIACSSPSTPAFTGIATATDICNDTVTEPSSIWINEFHYAQTGVDNNEFVEVAGPAGANLTGSTILLYRPSDGKVYHTLALSGTIPNQSNGKGVLSFSYPSETIINGIGAICLVQGSSVMDFIAYGSSFLAVNGTAIGTTPVNIGITESDAGPNTVSIQRTGNGRLANTFAWTGPSTSSAGSLNTGQTIAARPANGPAPTVSYTDTPSGIGPCGITILRKWKATDDCGLMSAIKTQLIRISPAALEVVDNGNEVVPTEDLQLKEIVGYELFQNVPNPFDHSTQISFILPESMRAKLSIYDVNGRLINYTEQQFDKGLNELKIESSDLKSQGVYYYKLDTPDWSATKRMVLIK